MAVLVGLSSQGKGRLLLHSYCTTAWALRRRGVAWRDAASVASVAPAWNFDKLERVKRAALRTARSNTDVVHMALHKRKMQADDGPGTPEEGLVEENRE